MKWSGGNRRPGEEAAAVPSPGLKNSGPSGVPSGREQTECNSRANDFLHV